MARQRISLAALAGLGILTASGCLSMHGNPTLDAVNQALSQGASSDKPYIEAYIEFPGPQERWAGPIGVVVHVKAKEGAPVDIEVNPSSFKPRAAVPKSILAQEGKVTRQPAAAPTSLSSAEVRERLSHLATAFQAGDSEFRGCASPVRVRLIRSDGALTDKRGCRVQTGWAQLASEVASELLASAATP